MFVPLHDKNALDNIRFQYVTVLLIILNVVIFVFFQTNLINPNTNSLATFSFALVPQELLTEGLFNNISTNRFDLINVPESWTLISYMFLHGGWLHLLGNMAFLWVFGDNVEDAMGHFRFLIFYLLCGVAAGLAHSWVDPNSATPLIGASGAVSGVIVAYLLLHPNIGLWVLVLWKLPIPVPAWLALGFWIILQFYQVYLQQTGIDSSNVAWIAHVGGIVAGAILVVFMKRKEFKLFDWTHR